jgi:Zn-dependent protease
MMFFGVGWANPVPINTRYFKNPRKGMALTAAAGPISNLLLAIIFTLLLRIVMIPMQPAIDSAIMAGDFSGEELFSNMGFLLLAILATILYLGIFLNINLMLFNLIPLPPLDGSRIAYIFLPTDLYFKIMKYERYIMIAFIVLLATNIITVPLGTVNGYISDLLYKITDMPVNYLYYSINGVLSRLPTFSL